MVNGGLQGSGLAGVPERHLPEAWVWMFLLPHMSGKKESIESIFIQLSSGGVLRGLCCYICVYYILNTLRASLFWFGFI